MSQESVPSSEPDSRALEEWRLLQAIIARLDGRLFKIRGWAFALAAALGGTCWSQSQSETSLLPWWLPGVGGTAVLLVSFLMETGLHVPKAKAINRSKEVEQALACGHGYDGPQLAVTMTTTRPSQGRVREFRTQLPGRPTTTWLPYGLVCLLVWLASLLLRMVGGA